jgi:hypothetical protein
MYSCSKKRRAKKTKILAFEIKNRRRFVFIMGEKANPFMIAAEC